MNTYVIASARPWNRSMVDDLTEKVSGRLIAIRDEAELTLEHLESIEPRYVFFPHWSHIIPEAIFTRFECVIFHMTDLPYGRGGSPLQNLIVRGHRETKISALRCVQELDAGDVYLKRFFFNDTATTEIYTRASATIEEMIVEMITHEPAGIPQQGEPTPFKRRTPRQSHLNQVPPALDKLFDYIRMLDAPGYPRIFCESEHFRLEFDRAELTEDGLTARVTFAPNPSRGPDDKAMRRSRRPPR